MMCRSFSGSKGSLMLSGFKPEKLFEIARKTMEYDNEQWKKQNPTKLDRQMTSDEREFYGLTLQISMEYFDTELKMFVNDMLKGTAILARTDIDKCVDEIAYKPFQNKLTEKQTKSLKTRIKEHLKKGFNKMNVDSLGVEDISWYLQRYFLCILGSDDEQDSVVVTREGQAIIRTEVKTYPQNGIVDPEKLQEVVESAAAQLEKSRKVLENIVAPMAKLSSVWSTYGLIFLPNIKTRAELSVLGLSEDQLSYILTEEQIEGNWLDGLKIDPVAAPNNEDYKNLASIFVGSLCVTFRCQEVDHTMGAEKRLTRQVEKVGKPNEGAQEWPNKKVKFTDLKKKPLHSILSIMYLNLDQLSPLSIKILFMIFLGDFGVGKTDMLMAAALKAAEDEDNIVFFLLGMKSAKILEIKNKKIFGDTAVRVVKVEPAEIEMFLKTQKEENVDKNIAVFMDEVEISTPDKKAIMTKKSTTSLATLLTTLQSNTKMSWLVLSTSSLLDTTDDEQKGIKLSEEDMKDYIETESVFKVTMLNKRVRNTSMVGVTAKQDVGKHYGSGGSSDYCAGVLQAATSHTIPGDRPVAVLADIGDIMSDGNIN